MKPRPEDIEMAYLLFVGCGKTKSGITKRLGPVLVNSSKSYLESKPIAGEWRLRSDRKLT